MQCERLIRQIKTWYLHVQNETMAPARMISFIEAHVSQCPTCLADPDLPEEIAKITKIVLPESMIPKAVRLPSEDLDESDISDEDELDETEEGDEVEMEEEDDNKSELFDLDDDEI